MASLEEHSEFLSEWLRGDALPLWLSAGIDRTAGGFYETVSREGRSVPGNRRARVQPRQVYCFVEAGRLGWRGRWREVVERGLDHFEEVYLREDGFFGAIASDDGRLIDSDIDLYNQAFALFAYAEVASALPDRAGEMAARAEALLRAIRQNYSHPEAGFEEARPRRLPLCSNPHMHLFEASLSWERVPGRGRGQWSALADEIAGLCMTRFIDPRTGALREFFDGDWRPLAGDKGRVVEPGHQFEWAWLLARWSRLRGDRRALAKARRLFDIAVDHGICARRRVAIMALDDDFAPRDETARLWPQTEWIKAALLLATTSVGLDRDYYISAARAGCAALRLFLETPLAGLWRDKMRPDGSFVEEPAPASSFYHIVCAIRELEAFVGSLTPEPVFERA